MKKYYLAALALPIAGVVVSGPAAAQTIKMTAVAAAPPQVSNVKATKDTFIPTVNKKIAAANKGFKIEWTQAYASSLAKFTEVLEAVEEGIGHLGMQLKTFEESKLPLEQIFYMIPFGDQTPAQLVDIDRSMRDKLPALNQQWAKYNQIFLDSGASPGMDLFTTFPVKTVTDLKGHKIGASGAMGHYLRNTGAVVVNSSMLESYTSIKNGVYEGYPISVGLAFPYRTYQAAKQLTRVKFGTTATSALTVNKDAWNKLPAWVQKIFRETAADWSKAIENIDAQREKIFVSKMKKAGVKMTDMPDSERRKWAFTLPNIAQEWAAAQEKKGLPGKLVLKTAMDELRARNVKVMRNWDRE